MSKKSLYLECYNGISGDMSVSALLDLGADRQFLENTLNSLGIDGYEIVIERKSVSGIDACSFDVLIPEDPAYDEGHGLGAQHEHCHDEENRHELCLEAESSHELCIDEEHSHEHYHDEEHPHEHCHDVEHHHEHCHDAEHHHEHCHDAEHHHEHCHNAEHHHEHCHNAEHHHEHCHDEGHHHGHGHHHHHCHRNLYDVEQILDRIQDERVKALSSKIFHIVAEAESQAHGKPLEEIHFHEVGAIDSIVDIVGLAACFVSLNVSDVIVSTLYEGQGHLHCQHGIMPVPAPAVLNILTSSGLPIHITENHGEMITPTGAAIAAALKTKDSLPTSFRILATGLGAGKKHFPTANLLRAMLIEEI